MKNYKVFGNYETVVLRDRTEVAPACFINDNVLGVITDKTVPNYYLVKFEDYGSYWIDGCLLESYTNTDRPERNTTTSIH